MIIGIFMCHAPIQRVDYFVVIKIPYLYFCKKASKLNAYASAIMISYKSSLVAVGLAQHLISGYRASMATNTTVKRLSADISQLE